LSFAGAKSPASAFGTATPASLGGIATPASVGDVATPASVGGVATPGSMGARDASVEGSRQASRFGSGHQTPASSTI
jgi:hypothetical protein